MRLWTTAFVLFLSLAWLLSCTPSPANEPDLPDDAAETEDVMADLDPDGVDLAPDARPEEVDPEDSGDADDLDEGALPLPDPLHVGAMASLTQPAGRGGFRFGAATAAAQIEDGLAHSDWHFWTLPEAQGGMGQGTPVGEAVQGATRALADVGLITAMHLDAYRFSIDWSRIEPERGVISEEGLAHYDALIDALVAAGVRPMVTLHHFSSPIWVHDFRQPPCAADALPDDTNLCGWGHPQGADEIVRSFGDFAALVAERYGDRVDEWCVLNEPVNYLMAAYGVGYFPPGENLLFATPDLVAVYRNYLRAYVAAYDAIKAHDGVDATGDGRAADVGLSLSIADWVPARGNRRSDHPDDVAAAEAVRYIYHDLIVQSLLDGTFDPDLDGSAAEAWPEWRGKLDWLGLQYYFRAGVSGQLPLIPPIKGTLCFGDFDFGACIPPADPSHYVPSMAYEFWVPGLIDVLRDYAVRYPELPLVITESGIATEVGERRAEAVVRVLEALHQVIQEGVDVRGYYHWSLLDNFEWAEGFHPRFGLYRVDTDGVSGSYDRQPTLGAEVLGAIAQRRGVSAEDRAAFGGNGPMHPEQP